MGFLGLLVGREGQAKHLVVRFLIDLLYFAQSGSSLVIVFQVSSLCGKVECFQRIVCSVGGREDMVPTILVLSRNEFPR